MKLRNSVIKTGLLVALSLGATSAWAAQISSSLTATSNYIWRGVTRTNDAAAIQGGADYTINKHFYAGAWTSNVAGDYELDLYGGYVNKFGAFDFDAGLVTYQYPGAGGIDDFTEAYAGAVYKNYSAKVSVDINESNIYLEGAADFELPDKYLLTAHVGIFSFDQAGKTDYNDYSVTISKGDLSFSLSDTSENVKQGQSDNVRVNISWSKTF